MEISDRSAESRSGWLAAGAIAAGALAAYHNSFSVPFVFDDRLSTADNPTIRHFLTALAPPHGRGLTVEGRPFLNLSLALNYAMSGTAVWSYHAVNLIIHVLAGLTLYALVRRTLKFMNRDGGTYPAAPLAFAVALLWTVHPLQTESVTYIVQRAESLMGLCYLLTLYCFVRLASPHGPAEDGSKNGSAGRRAWAWLSALACLFGMGTKEVMASAPLIVFLYDRTFVSVQFRRGDDRSGNC